MKECCPDTGISRAGAYKGLFSTNFRNNKNQYNLSPNVHKLPFVTAVTILNEQYEEVDIYIKITPSYNVIIESNLPISDFTIIVSY